jgi:hypothetical protein
MEVGLCVQIFRNAGMALIHHKEIEFRDEVRGGWEELGSIKIFNVTKYCYQVVYLQGSWATIECALKANGG